MKYDVGMEEASFLFLIIIYLYHKFQYSGKTLIGKRFRTLLVLGGITVAVDVISAYMIMYYTAVPLWLNNVVNCIYFTVDAMMTFYFTVYVKSVVYKIEDRKVRAYSPFNLVLLILFCISEIANLFLGFYFTFTMEDCYVKGPLYFIQIVLPLYYVAVTCITIFVARAKFGRNQIMSMYSYAALSLIFTIVQVLFLPQVLMTGCTFALASLIIMFSLETPDYQKLQKTMKELEEAKEEADRANAAKTEFLARMSHEIRTPINIMNGMNELILRDVEDEQIEEYALDARGAGETLLSLVNDILDFSRIESGKVSLDVREYNLRKMLKECISSFEQRLENKGLVFDVDADIETPCNLVGDEIKIKQIILNLLSNAEKYTPEGNVTLKVGYETISNDVIFLDLTVSDTGIGIKEEDVDNIFNDFERMDMDRNKSIQGTGLGLAITKTFVDIMDGKIDVESTYGEGSSFIIRIPQSVMGEETIGNIRRRKKPENKYVKYIPSLIAPEGRILLVDDIAMNLKVAVNLIKETQVKVDTAVSGKECITRITEEEYDVVFIDHMMPEMDGIETLRKLREEYPERVKDIKFIALTANAINGAREMYLKSGFDDYLSKPIKTIELEEILKKYLPVKKQQGTL
ncbi:MAG: ATP-binding protein [Lachnospiraceae bacterium]|nr:ATP-binding protein [Lachnospiraceae bacterium]